MTEAAANRRWWQRLRVRISMRTLMVLVLLIGGGLGWVVRGARIQREAVAAIENEGGVYYDWQWDLEKDTVLDPSKARLSTPKWLIDWVGVDYFHRVHGIMLGTRFGPAIPEDLMAQVARIEGLEYLSVDGEWANSDAMIAHFRSLTRLRELELDLSNPTQVSLLRELPNLKGLEHLAVSHVTDSNLTQLLGLTRLKWLMIQGSGITNDGLAQLSGLTGLEELILQSTVINDAGMNFLSGMSYLKSLDLSRANISDAGLEVLAKIPGLVSLDLSTTNITDQGLVHLRELTNLRHLSLVDTHITDAGLAQISGLTELQSLELSFTQITDAGLAQISGLTELQSLRLNGTKIDDAGLVHLSGLNKLTSLSLGSTRITDQGIINLAGLKSCEQVSVEGTAVTDAGIAAAAIKRPGTRFIRKDYSCF